MNTYLLQDWVSLSGDATAASTIVSQPSAAWLDLAHASELTFFLEVSRKVGAPQMKYDTAPLREGAMFQELASFAMPTTTTPLVTPISLYTNPAIAVARWVRWRIYSDVGSVWDVTFRLSVLAYRR